MVMQQTNSTFESEDSSNGSGTSGSFVKIEMQQHFRVDDNGPTELIFVPAPDESDVQKVTGSMDTGNSWLEGHNKWSPPGASFLRQNGFGWLVEVDDLDGDENTSLLEELDIDPKDILFKLRCVLFPVYSVGYDRRMIRDSPDFWGPLLVVLLFAAISLYGQLRVVSWIVTIWIFGSLVIFLLARVLGGEVSYSQCLGVIGYSVLPLVVSGTAASVFSSLQVVSVAVKLGGVLWATYSAGSLLCVQELQEKRPLLLYPIFLLYIYFLSLYLGV